MNIDNADQVKKYGFHIDRDPAEIMEQYGILGRDHAEKKARLMWLEDTEKTVLASIKRDIQDAFEERGGREPADAKLTRLALIDHRYIAHLEMLSRARHDSMMAEIAFKQEDKRIELIRSLEASARMQVERFGA